MEAGHRARSRTCRSRPWSRLAARAALRRRQASPRESLPPERTRLACRARRSRCRGPRPTEPRSAARAPTARQERRSSPVLRIQSQPLPRQPEFLGDSSRRRSCTVRGDRPGPPQRRTPRSPAAGATRETPRRPPVFHRTSSQGASALALHEATREKRRATAHLPPRRDALLRLRAAGLTMGRPRLPPSAARCARRLRPQERRSVRSREIAPARRARARRFPRPATLPALARPDRTFSSRRKISALGPHAQRTPVEPHPKSFS